MNDYGLLAFWTLTVNVLSCDSSHDGQSLAAECKGATTIKCLGKCAEPEKGGVGHE